MGGLQAKDLFLEVRGQEDQGRNGRNARRLHSQMNGQCLGVSDLAALKGSMIQICEHQIFGG
jgi:hypothetical protein